MNRGGQVAPGVLEVRPQPERLLKLIDGGVQISLRGERDAQVVVRFDRGGHSLERGSKLSDRVGKLAGFEEDAGQIVAGLTIVRIELDGTPKMGNRVLRRSMRRERIAQVAVRLGRIRLEAECFANASISSTSNARWVISEPTLTGPLASNLQISISSSLPGALKKTSSEPLGDFERWISSRPSTSL